MKPRQLNFSYADLSDDAFFLGLTAAAKAKDSLFQKNGKGSEFTGWVTYPFGMEDSLISDIEETAKRIRENADVLLVLGIGGSYIGAKSFIDAVMPKIPFSDTKPEIIYLGNNVDGAYIESVLKMIKGKSVYCNVISKSGTTTETAIAFRVVRAFMLEEYGIAYNERVIATTDRVSGRLKAFCLQNGIKTYVIPDDIGGRYSVFTPVGLLPIAVAGIDIREIIRGYKDAIHELEFEESLANDAIKYSIARIHHYRNGKSVEALINYLPQLNGVSEWWKQLFGESEGKDKKGLFPASMSFTTDLHSLGQFCQDGSPVLLETVISVKNDGSQLIIPDEIEDFDGLRYLEGKKYSEINDAAMKATLKAHQSGGLPCIVIGIEKINAYNLANLYAFFMVSCAVSAYMLEVNPFDQPGVEAYKTNMFRILGKPGY